MREPKEKLTEREIQRRIRATLADNSRLWRATDGSLLTILSVGEWNDGAGPDFLRIALLSEGRTFVGHAEVHKRSSDWFAHRHDESAAYAGALLHIVLADNAKSPRARYTLVMPLDILDSAGAGDNNSTSQADDPAETLAAIREYARQRLERKTREAADILLYQDTEAAFARLGDEFFRRNAKRRLFPNGVRRGAQNFAATPENITAAYCARIQALLDLERAERTAEDSPQARTHASIVQSALNHLEKPVAGGLRGTSTGREMAVNLMIPLALARASQAQALRAAQAIWEAYFLLPACGAYRALEKKFPDVPQRYVWQQQGLLEYEREIRAGKRPEETILFGAQREKNIVAVAATCNAHSALTLYDESSLRRA